MDQSEQQHLCPIFNNQNMKKIAFIIVLVVTNMSFFACDDDSYAETDSLYENLSATEGDDGDVDKNPDSD